MCHEGAFVCILWVIYLVSQLYFQGAFAAVLAVKKVILVTAV